MKSESSKAVRRKVQNIDIGSGFQGSADENNTGSNVDVIDLLMDQRVKEKKFKNQILEDDDDSDFTDMPDFSAVETNVTVQSSFPAEVQEKKVKNQILEDDDDDIPDLDFSAVETNVTVQPSSPAEEPEPIKQFKRISHKEKGNYCILPSFHSIQICNTKCCDLLF